MPDLESPVQSTKATAEAPQEITAQETGPKPATVATDAADATQAPKAPKAAVEKSVLEVALIEHAIIGNLRLLAPQPFRIGVGDDDPRPGNIRHGRCRQKP